MNRTIRPRTPVTAAALIFAFSFVPLAMTHAQPAPANHQADDEGKRLFRVNCAGCHKWHGNGGGGYGGDALSLRKTQFDRAQIIETIACGRPGTGMPYHQRDAYDDASKPCYGLDRQELGKDIPLAANNFLRPGEIAVIADYVLAEVKGKGDPNYAQCLAFFGDGSRVCNIYKQQSADGGEVK
jgi:hypothetical protein